MLAEEQKFSDSQLANKWLNDWNLKIVLFYKSHTVNPFKVYSSFLISTDTLQLLPQSVVQRFYHLKNKPCIL